MAMNYDHLMSLAEEGVRHDYSDRETMLYALGVGMGREPLDEEERQQLVRLLEKIRTRLGTSAVVDEERSA